MKRIFYITTTTNKEGPGNQLGALIENLDRKKYEPTVVTVLGPAKGEWDARYRELGVRRIDFAMRKPLDLLAPFRLLALLHRERPDLVQTQMLRADIYGRWAAGLLHIPYVTTVQNMDVWKRTGKPFDRYATWLDARQLKRARKVVAVSRAVARDLQERQSIPTDLIEVIYNSANVTHFATPLTYPERTAWRKALGIPADTLVVTDTGRFTMQKAPEVSLAASAMLLRDHPDLHIVRANIGPLYDQTRAAAATLGVGDRLHFMGFRLDIREMLHASDVFILPSRFEGLPTVLIEAMAAGVPCVATNVSGNPELIRDGETGLLVPPDDPAALAHAISKLLNDAQLRRGIAERARVFVGETFDAKDMAHKYELLYDRLLAVQHPQP